MKYTVIIVLTSWAILVLLLYLALIIRNFIAMYNPPQFIDVIVLVLLIALWSLITYSISRVIERRGLKKFLQYIYIDKHEKKK